MTERRPDRVDAGDGELHGREHRERRDEVIEDGVDAGEPTAARRAEPGEQPRHVSLGQLDAAALPSKVLARRLRHGLGHLGPQHGVGRVAHELPLEEQLILELGVLDEVTRPAAPVEQRSSEHHAVAVQAR